MDDDFDDMSTDDTDNNKSSKQSDNNKSMFDNLSDLKLGKKPTSEQTFTTDRPYKDPLAMDDKFNSDQLQSLQSEPTKNFDKLLNPSIYDSPESSLGERAPHPIVSHNRHSDAISPKMEKELVAYNHLTYLIYMISFFTAGLTWIVPIVMNYLRRGDAQYSWLATHFDWQIKTFWYSVIASFIGIVFIIIGGGGSIVSIFASSSGGAIGSLGFIMLGGFIILSAYLWHLYRLIRGWIALANKQPLQ